MRATCARDATAVQRLRRMELLTTKLAARGSGRSAVRARPSRTGGARVGRHAPSQVRSSVRARGGSGRPGAVTSAARRITTATPPPGAPHAAGPGRPDRPVETANLGFSCHRLPQARAAAAAPGRRGEAAPGRPGPV